MHPINFLFEEIYRDYWGIPRKQAPAREHRDPPPAWRRRRTPERDGSRL